jgi:hypothetical protein
LVSADTDNVTGLPVPESQFGLPKPNTGNCNFLTDNNCKLTWVNFLLVTSEERKKSFHEALFKLPEEIKLAKNKSVEKQDHIV